MGGVGRVLEYSGRPGLAGRGALMARQGSGRGPRQGSGRGLAAWNGFGLFREIQPCCALRRFSAGPSGRSRPRFPALPCCASRHIHVVPSSGLMPCPRHIHAAPLVPPFPSVRGRRWGVVARSGGGPGSPGRFGVSWGHPGRCGLAGRGAPEAWQVSGRGPRWGSGWRPAAKGLGFFRGLSQCSAFPRCLRHLHASLSAFLCALAGGLGREVFVTPPAWQGGGKVGAGFR